MDRLPQELVTHIASYIDRHDPGLDFFVEQQSAPSELPAYATISRPWQQAIESRTFRTLHFKSTELPYVVEILTSSHWRQLLSSLTYDVVLPTYTDNQCAKFETAEDMQRNNEAFTHAMHNLFQLLLTGQGYQGFSALSLDLWDCYSPMDAMHRDPAKLEDDREQYGRGKRHDLFENRYRRSVLSLLEQPELPAVECVRSFRCYAQSRPVRYDSAVLLAAKLPNAESVTLHLRDDEKVEGRLRQDYRHGLASALPSLSTLPLRDFTLESLHDDPFNQYFTLPSALLPSAPEIDHLSLALYKLSQSPTLTSIRLDPIIISPDLYWPANPSTQPNWPSLRQFHVVFNMTAPDGTWYFIRDPSQPEDEDEGADDSDDPEEEPDIDSDPDFDYGSDSFFDSGDTVQPDTYNERREARAAGDYPGRSFRTLPLDTYMNPLLLAMARAAAYMPKMQHMSLTSTVRDPVLEVSFFAGGQPSHSDSEPGDGDRPRLYSYMGKWRPDYRVLETWRESREGLVVKFIEW
ncbi:MAG: hypothetical protein Q9196_001283 [Gyalolechia fulgens]